MNTSNIKLSKGGIFVKIALPATAAVLLILILLSWFIRTTIRNSLENAFQTTNKSLAENLAYNSEVGVLAGQKELLQSLMQALLHQNDVRYIRILEKDGKQLAAVEKEGFGGIIQESENLNKTSLKDPHIKKFDSASFGIELYEISYPVMTVKKQRSAEEIGLTPLDLTTGEEPAATTQIGEVRLGVSTAEINGTLNRTIRTMVQITAVAVLLIPGLLAIGLYQVLIVPAKKLVDSMGKVAGGELSTQIEVERDDEIGELARSFNRMAQSLKQAYEELEVRVQERTKDLQIEILERTKTEREILKTQNFLHLIIENIPTMIFVKDELHLRFVRFNKAGEDLVGVSREELIGKNDYDFFPKEQADFFTSHDRSVLEHGKLVIIPEEKIETKTHGTRILHTKKIPIQEPGGQRYLLGISDDITERKLAEKEIEALNQSVAQRADELQKANKELEAFSYSVSHDLRAPLRAIDGFSRILYEDHLEKLDPEAQRLLTIIRTNTEKMGHLIDDLLAFSRLGRQQIRQSEINMTSLTATAIHELKHLTEDRMIDFKINELPAAYGDSSLIRQVMINFLSNAIKFTKRIEKPSIEVNCYKNGGDNVYYVRDNGAGFDMQYSNKLFGVFQRLHREDEFEGTGVGLAIVQRIVQKHGGKVWAESKPNEGATFYFSLPGKE